MNTPLQDGLVVLWASNGSARALHSVAIIRELLLPVCQRITVLTVAPVDHATTRRLTHLSDQKRGPDMAEADVFARRSLETLGPLNVPTNTLVLWGNASTEIAREADESDVDIVVMGTSAHRAIPKVMLGDASEDVLRSTSRSVLLARNEETSGSGPIVLVFDSARYFATAVSLVTALRLPADTPIWLVSFLEPAQPFGGMYFTFSEHVRHRRAVLNDVRRKLAELSFERAVEQLTIAGHSEVHIAIEEGDIVDDLGNFVLNLGAKLVVVGDSAIGSQAAAPYSSAVKIATRMPCSVLVAR